MLESSCTIAAGESGMSIMEDDRATGILQRSLAAFAFGGERFGVVELCVREVGFGRYFRSAPRSMLRRPTDVSGAGEPDRRCFAGAFGERSQEFRTWPRSG